MQELRKKKDSLRIKNPTEWGLLEWSDILILNLVMLCAFMIPHRAMELLFQVHSIQKSFGSSWIDL